MPYILVEMKRALRGRRFPDSSAARGMALRQGVGKVRHLDSRALWTQRAVAEQGLKVKKIDGKHNSADLGTKRHTQDEHERLLVLAGMVRAGDALSLVPTVEVNAIQS